MNNPSNTIYKIEQLKKILPAIINRRETLLFSSKILPKLCKFLRFSDMLPNFFFMLLAIEIGRLHKLCDLQGSIHTIQGIQNQLSIYHHCEKIRIDTTTVFSGKIGVDVRKP